MIFRQNEKVNEQKWKEFFTWSFLISATESEGKNVQWMWTINIFQIISEATFYYSVLKVL